MPQKKIKGKFGKKSSTIPKCKSLTQKGANFKLPRKARRKKVDEIVQKYINHTKLFRCPFFDFLTDLDYRSSDFSLFQNIFFITGLDPMSLFFN